MSKKKQLQACQMSRKVMALFNSLDFTLPRNRHLHKLFDVHTMIKLKTRFSDLDAQLVELTTPIRLSQQPISEPAIDEKLLANLATNAWRAKAKMVNPNTGEAKEEMRRVYRHIEAIFEDLNQIGVETIDPTGYAYDSGMALKVISFEQTPGLSKEEITETIKPSVAWQGRLIQMGEVIVGTPQKIIDSERGVDEENNH